MGYVNPLWLQVDAHAKDLFDEGVYAEVEPIVDAELYRVCADRGIVIPVDGNGYVSSEYLQTVVTPLAIWKLLSSVVGVRDDDMQVYQNKAGTYQQEYYMALANLCYSKV